MRLALAASLATGALSTALPLARVPGFESALAANVVVAILGGILGVASARQERQLSTAGQRVRFEPSPSSLTAALRSTFAAFLPVAGIVAAFACAASIAGLFGPHCSITAGLGWYPVLPLPSALLSCAVGVLCGALFSRRFAPGLAFAGILLLSLVASALPLAVGPQAFLYNALAGYLPGPLYDEVVRIGPALLWYRLHTLVLAAAAIGAGGLAWGGKPAFRPASMGLLAASLALAFWGFSARHEHGWEQSAASVENALGARREGARCTVILPRELDRADAARFVDECDHRVDELEAFFGVHASRPTVFLYRSKEEKRRLTGAAGTQFAKPWLGQIHVENRGFPHPILKHELAHLVAGPLGRAPFDVAASAFGLLPIQGLVEGAAVAADWPPGELSVHEEAKAMRELGLAPRLDRILSATGFWSESAPRAYTYAGSFVRWLVETRGPERFGRLYRDGDFEAAYGAPLAALVHEWERHLDELELADGARALAELRFRRPAIFRRPCAREVAELSADAGAALASGDGLRSAELYGRCAALDPGDPTFLRAQAAAFASAGSSAPIESLLDVAERHPARTALLRANLLALLGDARAKSGELSAAASAYAEAAKIEVDAGALRTLTVKLEATSDPRIAAVVLPYLDVGSDTKLLAIRELLTERPDFRTGWYLVGRRLQQRGEAAAALDALDRALEPGLLPVLSFEAGRLRALALIDLGRAAEACPALERLAEGGTGIERSTAADLHGLCVHRTDSKPGFGHAEAAPASGEP
ncbi:hypothetical protein AKJ08_1702 [Vulgatibacter incomptus]|uniref:Tetratricopeptide repeat protein n=1 Tax=Vulgatibacter incomptus TaxID=1391653 RepID=A0A0K1PCR8_9BACT|nr:hypothetical protein AKJ08_1702 [Vulgatibacter incomptus]